MKLKQACMLVVMITTGITAHTNGDLFKEISSIFSPNRMLETPEEEASRIACENAIDERFFVEISQLKVTIKVLHSMCPERDVKADHRIADLRATIPGANFAKKAVAYTVSRQIGRMIQDTEWELKQVTCAQQKEIMQRKIETTQREIYKSILLEYSILNWISQWNARIYFEHS